MIRSRLHVPMTAIATLMLGGCAGLAPQDLTNDGYQAVDGAELQALHDGGVTTEWSNPRGVSGTTEFRPDGSATVDAPERAFEGEWEIRGDEICTRYDGLNGGDERCYTVYGKAGEPFEWFVDGDHHVTVTYPSM